MSKLSTLAEIEGFESVIDLLENDSEDSLAHGICVRPGCTFITEVEPDCTNGWCDECCTNTVKSSLVLAKII